MRNYAGSAMMLVVTMAAALGCYTINLKVSSERAAVESLRRQLVVDARDTRNLQAELRTRARLPEMQRWNDEVLLMSAPVAGQFLRSPVQLASYGAAPAPRDDVQYAVATPDAAPAGAALSTPLQKAGWTPGDAARATPVEGVAVAPPEVRVAAALPVVHLAAASPVVRVAVPARPNVQPARIVRASYTPSRPLSSAVLRNAAPALAARSPLADLELDIDLSATRERSARHAVPVTDAPLADGGQ